MIPINVLSLFNGIEGISVALERAGIKVNQVYASEIDPYANKIAKKNFPNTIHLGDIRDWKSWNLPKIDLLVGGFPCQSFSFSGKQLNFEDPRGQLFFDLIAIKNYYNPKYFLFENVPMNKYILNDISKNIGVDSVEINSSLVSAQNRSRRYWFNWNHKLIKDKYIYLKDIWTSGQDITKQFNKKKFGSLSYIKSRFAVRTLNQKSKGLTTDGQGIANNGATNVLINGRYYKPNILTCERLQTYLDDFTKGIILSQRYKCLGNSFTVDIITHILKSMFFPIKYKKIYNLGMKSIFGGKNESI